LVDDLLDFAKIEAGKLELELRATDLTELLRNNLILGARSAQHKNIELVSKIEGQPRPILIDARRIEQVLNNLVSNAVKFSQPGTRISVTLHFDDRELILTVADQGLGIPANELGNLFKPFSRTSNVGTANESSTGLGLVITRRIVEAHRGRIQVDSQVGVGSTFRVILPLH
jgi:signal transduction histidine kinase